MIFSPYELALAHVLSRFKVADRPTRENFNYGTKVVFERATEQETEEVLSLKPDYVSDSGSKYWYDRFGEGVWRYSDHWGQQIGRGRNAWFMEGQSNSDMCWHWNEGYVMGHTDWEDFELLKSRARMYDEYGNDLDEFYPIDFDDVNDAIKFIDGEPWDVFKRGNGKYKLVKRAGELSDRFYELYQHRLKPSTEVELQSKIDGGKSQDEALAEWAKKEYGIGAPIAPVQDSSKLETYDETLDDDISFAAETLVGNSQSKGLRAFVSNHLIQLVQATFDPDTSITKAFSEELMKCDKDNRPGFFQVLGNALDALYAEQLDTSYKYDDFEKEWKNGEEAARKSYEKKLDSVFSKLETSKLLGEQKNKIFDFLDDVAASEDFSYQYFNHALDEISAFCDLSGTTKSRGELKSTEQSDEGGDSKAKINIDDYFDKFIGYLNNERGLYKDYVWDERKRFEDKINKSVQERNEGKVRKKSGKSNYRFAKMKKCAYSSTSYRGSDVMKMLYLNDYSDPSILYDGYEFNYYDIDDALWDSFCELFGYDDSDSGFPEVEDEFSEYVCEMGPSYLDDVIWGGYFHGDSKTWKTSRVNRKGVRNKVATKKMNRKMNRLAARKILAGIAEDYAENISQQIADGEHDDEFSEYGEGAIVDIILDYVDGAFIYYDDAWDLLKEYKNPFEIIGNDGSLYDDFVSDIEFNLDEDTIMDALERVENANHAASRKRKARKVRSAKRNGHVQKRRVATRKTARKKIAELQYDVFCDVIDRLQDADDYGCKDALESLGDDAIPVLVSQELENRLVTRDNMWELFYLVADPNILLSKNPDIWSDFVYNVSERVYASDAYADAMNSYLNHAARRRMSRCMARRKS